MTKKVEFDEQARSIETLVGRLEEAADPALRAASKDLVQAVMDLHGRGLERILEMVRETGDAGSDIIERLARDPLVGSVLLLHGLHPDDLRTRVSRALEANRAFLKSHGAKAELVAVDETGGVTVHFEAQAGGCGSAASSVKAAIEAAIQDAAPDASSVVVKDTGAPDRGAGFIPVSELLSGPATSSRPRVYNGAVAK